MPRITRAAAAVLVAVLAAAAVGCGSSSAPSKLNATITVENAKQTLANLAVEP